MRRGAAALAHPDTAGGTFVRLADGETWSHVPVPGGLRITGVSGDLWVTQEGDERDTTVSDGERFVTSSTGKVVVEALGDATFRVEWNHEEDRAAK
jgi:hypothetical protein